MVSIPVRITMMMASFASPDRPSAPKIIKPVKPVFLVLWPDSEPAANQGHQIVFYKIDDGQKSLLPDILSIIFY